MISPKVMSTEYGISGPYSDPLPNLPLLKDNMITVHIVHLNPNRHSLLAERVLHESKGFSVEYFSAKYLIRHPIELEIWTFDIRNRLQKPIFHVSLPSPLLLIS